MSHGEGATLTDIDGNRYIDFYAGVTVASLGHAHPDLVAVGAAFRGYRAVGHRRHADPAARGPQVEFD